MQRVKSLNKQILQLAIPSILANITIPLVGLVDTAIVGHISDAAAIGGIAVGGVLFDLLYWNFGFLRVGTSGLTAQAYGEAQSGKDETGTILVRSLGIAGTGALLILLLQWVFVTAALAVMPCSAEVAQFARTYFFIRVWAAPATLSLMALKGWFIGMQDTVSPMAVDITVNVVNMVVSYVLAVYTPLEAVGVAWGTLVAQWTGLVLAAILLLTRYPERITGLHVGQILRDIPAMHRLLVLNGNLFLRSLCMMVVYVGYTALASRYGDTELAVSAMMMRLMMLFSYLVDGFAYAGEALVGKNIGRGEALRPVIRLLFMHAMVLGLVFTVLFGVWGDACMALLSSDETVLTAASRYRLWLSMMPILSTLAFMWDGVYAGATAGVKIRNSMIWAALAFVVCYALGQHWLGVHAIYLGYMAHLVARSTYLSSCFSSVFGLSKSAL